MLFAGVHVDSAADLRQLVKLSEQWQVGLNILSQRVRHHFHLRAVRQDLKDQTDEGI